VRKIYAPIWVNGPLQNFVYDRMIIVGDAAGQSKPTTGGGIYSCGMGGLLAGRAVVEAAAAKKNRDRQLLLTQYEKNWFSMFKSEFDKMLLARRFMERLDNKGIDDLVAAISPETLEEASIYGDFDFHTTALAKMLGSKTATKMAKALLGNEIRRFLEGG
jgi:digeranylgeranylglycerophospholipid reductase